MSWGQGELIATPAAVARMAAGVSNQGNIVGNRYVLKVSNNVQGVKGSTKLTNNPKHADIVKDYMLKQSAPKTPTLGIAVGGKTGTPERIWKKERINDGWYVFFTPKAKGAGHVVVCIRVESTKGSSDAVALAGKHVIPFLTQRGVVKGFGAAQPGRGVLLPGNAPAGAIISPVPFNEDEPANESPVSRSAAPASADTSGGN
jgi:cell division protein FtsI/penicillin-binding protein 2